MKRKFSLLRSFFVLALLCSYEMQAQQKIIFDGKDDYAIVQDHELLNINEENDFTIEFFIDTNMEFDSDRSLLAKHDGDKGIVCAISSDGRPFLRVNGKVYIAEKALLGTGCQHLVFIRKGGNLFIVIDNIYYEVGQNSSNLSNNSDLVIGNSPNTPEYFYQGDIDEIRFWRVYRTEVELQEYSENCLIGHFDALIAHWNIEEEDGQFINDMANNLHARFGDFYQNDPADPIFERSSCDEKNCCDLVATFDYSQTGNTFNFQNTSNGGTYVWYIKGIMVSTDTDLTHSFQSPGDYEVSLAATAKNGCKSIYTVHVNIEVSEEIDFCNDFIKTYTDPTAVNDDNVYFDRFGNQYSENELRIPSTATLPPGNAVAKSLAASACDCDTDFGINTNHFDLYFEDCGLGTGTGFDDPTVSGSSTLGRERRRTVCQVYADLSQSILQNNATCGNPTNNVRVLVMPSQANGYYPDGTNLAPLPATVGGAASAFTTYGPKEGIVEVMPWIVLNTGADQQFSYNTPFYHGFLRINFSGFTQNWQVDHTVPVLPNKVDLYSVALHESMHMLGMASNLIYDGANWKSRLTGTSTGGYSRWDSFIKRATGNLDVITNLSGYNWDLNPGLSAGDLLNSCNGIDLWVGNNQAPLYSGTISNYSAGSSLSHLDENCIIGSNFVLNPTINTGDDKRTLSITELQLFADLGYKVAGYSNCVVTGVDDFYGNCSKTFVVSSCPGSSLNISTADLIANDINATGSTNVSLLSNTGNLQMVTSGSYNSDYILSPNINSSGDLIIRYQPVGCGSQFGNTTYAVVQVIPCADCSFPDVAVAQTTNSSIIDNGSNCGNSPSAGKCVDCGYNKNPDNLICNPEFCADDTNLVLDYSHFDCNGSAVTGLPGWYRAIATPGYVSPNINNAPGAPQNEYATPMHPNSGYLHSAVVNGSNESMYTDVSIIPGQRYFYSNYANSSTNYFGANAELQILMLSANYNVGTQFSCANSYNNYPPIYAPDFINVMDWDVQEHHIPANGNNNYPFDRNGSFVNVPANFPGAYLLITNRRLQGNNGQVDIFVDQVELVEDNFSAGDDQNITCGLSVDLGGHDFGMLSDVNVQYTWTNQLTGSVEADYRVERELDGTFIVFDIVNSVALSQIPTITVTPGVTTTYTLTRSFILDTDGTYGGLPASIFNGVPLTDDVIVNVPAAPIANASFTHAITCNVSDFLSDPATIGSPFSHSWDIDGDGNWDYFTENPSHAYAFNGTYNVIHEVSNGCGTFVSNQQVIITNNTLSLNLVSSNPGPLAQFNNFTVAVTVSNIGSATINNIMLALPAPLPSAGLSYSYGPTNIGSLAAGQSTVINVPVSVIGICGSEQVCAEIISADNACSIPLVCTSPLDIVTNPPLDQAIQVSNTLTTTYPAPYVVGGLVEFEVTATNLTGTVLNNIDMDYLPNGLSLIGSSPANFSLTANGSSSFTVLAKVLDCNQFSLESIIESADDTCPGNSPTDQVSGAVTPYIITVSAMDQVCSNSTNLPAQVMITNPSSQTITDVRVLPTSSSNSFQNIVGNLSNLTLTPNGTTTTAFTFESTGNLGNAFICASIESIGTGTDLINYSCVNNQSCTPVAVFDNPVTVTLTATPTDGTHRCIYQNARINYVLEITNNLAVPINNMQVNSVLSGLILVTGQNIPTTLSLPANGSVTYIFGGDAQIPAGSADLTVDVITNITGCSVASASTSHPIFYTVNDVLSSTSVISTPGPYVYGQTVAFDVTVTNFSPYQINGIQLNGVDPSFANSLNNISSVPLFDLPAGASVVKTITAKLTNCNIWEFYGQITETASTCFGNLISTRLDGVVSGGFSISMSPINTICDNGTGTVDFQVFNPTAQTLNNVLLTAAGPPSGVLFSSFGSLGSVSLIPGFNNFSIPFTANSGASGTENICVNLDQVGSLPYNCSNVQACGPATVIKDMEVFAYTIPINPTSFCAGQYVNFVSGFTNNSNVPVSITFNNTLVGATVINSASLTGSATVNPGASYSITYVTTINNTGSLASLTSDYTTINATTCSGSNNYIESVSVPILTPLNQALTVNSAITNTYPAPHVVGGQVEFEVTVANGTSGVISNIDLNFTNTGLTNLTSSPVNFSLAGGINTTFLVSGMVTDCSSFNLVSQIASASGICSSGAIIETVSGAVTPFGLSVSSPTVACVGASGMQADITINNPSGQTISDVNLSALTSSTLFQNVNLSNPISLLPGNNIVNFTFDSNGSTGSENVCVTINSIGLGINAIPYSCPVNQACDLSSVITNPVQVSLTANPTDGTAICVDQNPIINYTLTINNPTGVDLTGLNITSVLNGVTLNSGQVIPSSVSILAGATQTYQFSGTAIAGLNNAIIQINVGSNLAGCTNASATISHPLYRDLSNVLQINAIPLTSAPYVMGEVISYQVTVTNNSSSLVNNIDLDYQHTGLINATLSPTAFNLAAGASNTFVINAIIDDCQLVSFLAELLSADQTCANVNPMVTINTPVTPYTVQLSGPDLTCSGSTSTYTVDVFHPGSTMVSNVVLSLTGGSAFNGLPITQSVTLQPGNNSFPINVASITGFNGIDNLCAAITQIGGSIYNCAVAPCKAIEFTDNPITVSVQQANHNLLCSNGTASFDVTITNMTNTDLTGINFAITSSTYSPINLPSNVSLLAGSSQSFTIDGNILANVSFLNFCLDVTQVANLSCLTAGSVQGCVINMDVNNLSLPLEVEEALTMGSPALSLEAIYDLALDAEGNMYGVGVMGSQASFNANGVTNVNSAASCPGWVHPFVFKYSNHGIDWVSTPDGCGIPTSIDINGAGEVFVGLNLFGTLNFAGGSYSSAGTTDIAILKYSASGAEQAVLLEGGSGSEYIADLKVQGSKIFITGSTMALHPTLQGPGYTGQYILGGNTYIYHDYYYPHNNAVAFGDAFTASYSISGTTFTNNWISVIESPIIPNKIELDATGNSYVVGVALKNFLFPHLIPGGTGQFFAQTAYANGVPDVISGANYDIDAFVISYSPSGTNRWGGLYGSTSMDYPETLVAPQSNLSGSIYHQTDIAISASGQLYVAFQSLVTYFGQPSGSAVYSFQQQMGSHIVNLNPANGRIGVSEWSVPAGSPVTQPLNGVNVIGNAVMHPVISVDNDDNVFLSGVYNLSTQLFQTADFYSTSGGPAPLLLASPANEKGLVTEKFDVNGNFEWADVNSTFVPYNGPYHPTFTPGNNPLRPLDLEVNACGVYQTLIMDGSMEVNNFTYNGTPYDAFVFRIVDSPLGHYYGRTSNSNMSEKVPLFEDESNEFSVTIYPNPTTGRFTTTFENSKNDQLKSVTIYNTNGVKIQSEEVTNQSVINFDLADQPLGMYYVKFVFETRVITKPIILM